MAGQIEALYHYPVKGLSGQRLGTVMLHPGAGFPEDRVFGFARHDSSFDPDAPKPVPKSQFVVLARDAALARLATDYDPQEGTLRITGQGQDRTFDLKEDSGGPAAAAFLAAFLGYEPGHQPTLQASAPHRFTDVSVVSPQMMNAISLINIDSVRAFSEAIGQDVNPLRFRANLLFSGIAPMRELDLVGREISLGEATLRVVMRTKRCPATQVNLETGLRDLDVPRLLRDQYGHSDMGVYAEVIKGGRIAPGDAVATL
ncbi:MOSC domain-containing protein [Sulfitobacter sp. TSTF-M16]|uniref:MOSC domain-containing protein n=1 Tax=Sulfitobacter aestuariivivens TaxID=2766981 RepID=A0A927HGL1_9RHOB|nr:MOSC domain-containing protein [Sulfitobacter aestuariivivens]MBD3666101.1 MOSC domain-containing protein [Sulfitobacter aestuariivivens]